MYMYIYMCVCVCVCVCVTFLNDTELICLHTVIWFLVWSSVHIAHK